VLAKVSKPRNHEGPDLTYGGLNPYHSWEQIAAYFDGDGSVSVRVRRFTLAFSLEFSESYLPQLSQTRDFLASEGIKTLPITTQRRMRSRTTNYVLRITTQREVLLLCKKMLPYSYKKDWDLQTVRDYLQDRITGDEALQRLNLSVASGRREGIIRGFSKPFRKSEGIHISALIGGRRSSAKRVKLSKEQVEALRKVHDETGRSFAELSRMFKVSTDVVRTALGRK
jgi:LAGLIDADG-like domain